MAQRDFQRTAWCWIARGWRGYCRCQRTRTFLRRRVYNPIAWRKECCTIRRATSAPRKGCFTSPRVDCRFRRIKPRFQNKPSRRCGRRRCIRRTACWRCRSPPIGRNGRAASCPCCCGRLVCPAAGRDRKRRWRSDSSCRAAWSAIWISPRAFSATRAIQVCGRTMPRWMRGTGLDTPAAWCWRHI